MKERIQTLVDSFTDYAGTSHKFMIAAVSIQDENWFAEYAESPYRDVNTPKSVRIGVSVCNPTDEWNEDMAREIAVGRARKNTQYALFATRPGMINTALVDALLQQEAKFIRENPSQVIPGYNDSKLKYLRSQELKKMYDALTEDEKKAIAVIDNSDAVCRLVEFATDEEWKSLTT